MENVVHLVAVAIGWLIWTLTGNIILAALLALLAEGIIITLLVVVGGKRKQAKEQLAAWQAGTGPMPPQRKLGWRIALTAVVGLSAAIMTIGWIVWSVLSLGAIAEYENWGYYFAVTLIVISVVLIFLVVLFNLRKALKWNKNLQS
ncbi:MAG TPA: hypothetical protein DEQ02_06805 [Ruminococcaceae bacterium]|nr:hypothetical protein [Oscillospiraceae bacterium]